MDFLSKYYLKKRFKRLLTNKLFEYIEKRNSVKYDWEKGLRKVYEYKQKDDSYGSYKCPSGTEVKLLSVAFSDMILLENFDNLESGLYSLIKKFGKGVISSTEKNLFRFKKAFLEFHKKGISRTHHIELPGIRNNFHFNLIENIQIDLHLVSASAAIIVIYAMPNEYYKLEFQKIINSPSDSDLIITKIGRQFPYFHHESSTPLYKKNDEINDFFKKLFKQVSSLILSEVGAHLKEFESVPRTELITMDDFYHRIPKSRKLEKLEKEEAQFLSGLGYQTYRNPYYNQYLIFNNLDRQRDTPKIRNSYAGFIDDDYMKNEFSSYTGDNYKYVVQSFLSRKITPVMYLKAIECYLQDLYLNVIQLKSEITPEFNSGKRMSLRKLKTYITHVSRLKFNSVNLDRISFLIDQPKKNFFLREISKKEFRRVKYRKGDSNDIIEDFDNFVKSINKRIEENLDSITSSFQELTQFKDLVSARTLQFYIFAVALFTMVLILINDFSLLEILSKLITALVNFFN